MYKKKFQSMVTGPIGCVGLHVLVPVEAEWKHVHVCVRIRRHRRVETIVWEVHMKCSSALRLYVLVSITCTSFKYYFFLTFWSLVIFYKNKTWLKPLCIMKLMEIGAIGHHGPNARRHVGVETRSDHVTVVTRRPPMEENPVLEIQHSHRHAQTQHVLVIWFHVFLS